MAKVLIIDDDPDVTRLLEIQLEEEGHEVAVAHQGEEGMAKALKMTPDLILLDVFLPDATGFQVFTQIRKDAATRSTPVIMMSGASGAAAIPKQMFTGVKNGVNEFLSKPFNAVELKRVLHKYLPKRQPVKPATEERDEEPHSPLQISFMVTPETAQSTASEPEVFTPAPWAATAKLTPEATPPIFETAPEAEEGFMPAVLGATDRFIDFGMDIVGFAGRLCSTDAETFLAKQLMRTSLSVGGLLHASRHAASKTDFMAMLRGALNDLRETAYWLMIARKAGLLKALAQEDLEKTCQSLITLLNDFVNAEKKRALR